jgi:hypothetical protein
VLKKKRDRVEGIRNKGQERMKLKHIYGIDI